MGQLPSINTEIEDLRQTLDMSRQFDTLQLEVIYFDVKASEKFDFVVSWFSGMLVSTKQNAVVHCTYMSNITFDDMNQQLLRYVITIIYS